MRACGRLRCRYVLEALAPRTPDEMRRVLTAALTCANHCTFRQLAIAADFCVVGDLQVSLNALSV